MQQTPLHHVPNMDLLNVMPKASRVVEAGASSGALAQAYKQQHPECHYVGIEIDPEFASIAGQYCDQVLLADLDALSTLPPAQTLSADCWVFGDCLEHLNDPWRVLRWVHQLQPKDGVICACIPNAQHWSVQARLNSGDFFYEPAGLLDHTHLRWFTKKTILELFEHNGYQIEALLPRMIRRQAPATILQAIRTLAEASGGNPDQAEADSLAFQYIVRAKRKASAAQ
jgi:SAM-dependent methyltransferase